MTLVFSHAYKCAFNIFPNKVKRLVEDSFNPYFFCLQLGQFFLSKKVNVSPLTFDSPTKWRLEKVARFARVGVQLEFTNVDGATKRRLFILSEDEDAYVSPLSAEGILLPAHARVPVEKMALDETEAQISPAGNADPAVPAISEHDRAPENSVMPISGEL